MIKCPECGHEVSDRAKTCPHCGVAIAGNITICPDCGEIILKDASACPNCHCPINGAAPYEPQHDEPASPTLPADGAQDAAGTPTAGSHSDQQPQKPKRKMKRTYTAFVVSVVIALIVVLLGLYFYQNTMQQNELRAYNNAVSSGEPAVLQNFLDMYADAPKAHRDSIELRLDELKKIDEEWDRAVASLSKTELLRYVERHPGNIHVTEARLLIDSLDWVKAQADNTADAYQLYLDEHPSGQHTDEAGDLFARLDAQRVKPEDRSMLRQLFQNHFSALARGNEELFRATLAADLSRYMNKEHATQQDAVDYMHSLFDGQDVKSLNYSIADDMQITKTPTEQQGMFAYTVTLNVEQRSRKGEETAEQTTPYRVTARISPAGLITSLAMQRVVKRESETERQ